MDSESLSDSDPSTTARARAVQGIAIPQLFRSSLIRQDLSRLRVALGSHAEHVPSLELPPQSPRLRRYVDHITTSTRHRPELLFAYTWVLYTTLFQGSGRIRKALKAAGPAFWNGSASPSIPDDDTLSLALESDLDPASAFRFLTFSDSDAEIAELHALFHRRFHEASQSLPPETRKEIVREATHLFIAMIMMVEELDEDLTRHTIRRLATDQERRDWTALTKPLTVNSMPSSVSAPSSSSSSSSPERQRMGKRSTSRIKPSTTPLLEKGFPLDGAGAPSPGLCTSFREKVLRVWDDRMLYLRYLVLMIFIFYLGYLAGKASILLRAEDVPARRRR